MSSHAAHGVASPPNEIHACVSPGRGAVSDEISPSAEVPAEVDPPAEVSVAPEAMATEDEAPASKESKQPTHARTGLNAEAVATSTTPMKGLKSSALLSAPLLKISTRSASVVRCAAAGSELLPISGLALRPVALKRTLISVLESTASLLAKKMF